MADWQKPPAVNHSWGYGTITYLLLHADQRIRVAIRATDNRLFLTSCQVCLLQSFIRNLFFFGLHASTATHYNNHSGCVAYVPCLQCIVLLRSDTMACTGQGEHRRGGEVHHLQVQLFPHTFLHIVHYKQLCFCFILPFLCNNPVFIFIYLNDHVFSPM